MHADLFRADYWRALQTAYVKGMWKMFMRIGASSGLRSIRINQRRKSQRIPPYASVLPSPL